MKRTISAEIVVDTRKRNKSNKFPLKIRVYDGVNSHRYIALKQYQEENILVRNLFVRQREAELDAQLEYINRNGLDLEKSLDIIKNGIPSFTSAQERILLLEQELKMLKSKEFTVLFSQYLDQFIEDKLERGQKVKTFLPLKAIFKDFTGEFYLNEIDYKFLEKYYTYNKKSGNSFAYFKLNFNNLKQVYFDAVQKGVISSSMLNPFANHNFINYDQKKDFSLSVEEFKKLYENRNFERNHKNADNFQTQRAIHLYLFLFLIGGHNFVELSHLKWTNIKGNRIQFYRQKLKSKGGGQFIDNLIPELGFRILESYGTPKSKYLFDFIPDINMDEVGYDQALFKFNYFMKIVVRDLEISKSIRSNSSRHTFNTIAHNLLINQHIIESIQGHKSKDMTFNYFGKRDYSVQDREHLKVISEIIKQDD